MGIQIDFQFQRRYLVGVPVTRWPCHHSAASKLAQRMAITFAAEGTSGKVQNKLTTDRVHRWAQLIGSDELRVVYISQWNTWSTWKGRLALAGQMGAW